jgi:hypothetical protein|tara:strand:+ start:635 stop:823 length:189 start_codon:yes stop_codon:yes gene_type:complete
MAKSRNRKNHSKKVLSRNLRLKQQENSMNKQMEVLKEEYIKKMAEKSKESETDAGEVPLKLG